MIAAAWVISLVLWPPWIYAWPYIEGDRKVPEGAFLFLYFNGFRKSKQILNIYIYIFKKETHKKRTRRKESGYKNPGGRCVWVGTAASKQINTASVCLGV